jgi:peptidoglycan-N-acetylglucosamine deacetylase
VFSKRTRKRDKRFIFQDGSGRRWKKVWMISLAVFLFLSVVLSVIGYSLFNNPALPQLVIEDQTDIVPINEPLAVSGIKPNFESENQNPLYKIPRDEIYGYYLTGDRLSKESLKHNIDTLGVLIPDWYWLNSGKTIITTNSEKEIIDLAKKHDVKIMPSLSVGRGVNNSVLEKFLHSADSRTDIVNSLHKQVKKDGYEGININLEEIQHDDKEMLTLFVTELYDAFNPSELTVTITVSPLNDAYDLAALAEVTDRVIVKLFKELAYQIEPGPAAPMDWVLNTLNELPVPHDKIIISLSNEGYEWDMYRKEITNCLSFYEVMKLAASSELKVQWNDSSSNPYIRYTKDNIPHVVWFLDAVTSYNQINLAMKHDTKGIAIEELGYEDPGIWEYVGDTSELKNNVKALETMENQIPIVTIGSGEVIQLSGKTQQGERKIHVNEDGFIIKEDYKSYPLPRYIMKYGDSEQKLAVLTFDDGPNPAYTSKILDILSNKEVPATFYVVGKQAALYPDIVKRIYREGHEIGNHTFNHSDIKKDGAYSLQMEFNSTQRLIRHITGHSTMLYRPPYTTDIEYQNTRDLLPYFQTQEMGYTMVGAYIDPKDWQPVSSGIIVQRVMDNLSEGNVILLHDSGGDRTATINALPEIIDKLRAKGYTFVTTNGLIDKSRDEIMPPVQESTFSYMFFYKIGNTLFIWVTVFCKIFFILGIALGILRLLILFIFSYRQNRKSLQPKDHSRYPPFISIVIPAYNEETVIKNTVHSILKSNYRNFEVIIVNDGSTDNTAEAVKRISRENIRVRQILQANEGKTAAINKGVQKARGEIIIILDADTSIVPNSLSLLVNHFKDENVAGVSGNVRVGNIRNLMTLWQHVEYVTGFNLEKRAFNELNCITVVPGAIGAWRKSAIEEAGFFEEDTLAEDTDMTIKLLRKGYRINYEPGARAYTEAPEDIRSFTKQRFRWSYGILQCLWKHAGALFNPKQKGLGFVGLPYMWLQYILQAFAPLIDVVFLIGLLGDTPKIVTYYILFFLVDLLVSFYAFRLEKASSKPLFLLFIQRFIYRQFLTYTVWKSIAFAARGVLIGWNKLKRSGNVKLP